jgi:hypothetical protein
MRIIAIALLAVSTFATAMLIERSDANAVVCGHGRWRAGCVGPNGGVVVRRRPVVVAPAVVAPVCHRVWVNGVRVRRCI